MTLLTCSDNRALRHPNPRYYNAGTLYSENCALPVPEVVARYPVVFTADKQQEKKERSGAWVLRPGFSPPVGHDIDIRYQTKECLASSDIKHKQFPPECQYSAANSYTYEAVGQAEAIARTKEYPKTHDGALPTYCFVGASHGRDVGAAFAAVANSTLATMHYLRATHLVSVAYFCVLGMFCDIIDWCHSITECVKSCSAPTSERSRIYSRHSTLVTFTTPTLAFG